jgi:hypothetical protein
MADTDRLRPYKRGTPTTMGDDRRYVAEEFRRLENCVSLLIEVLKSLEARIEALEP